MTELFVKKAGISYKNKQRNGYKIRCNSNRINFLRRIAVNP